MLKNFEAIGGGLNIIHSNFVGSVKKVVSMAGEFPTAGSTSSGLFCVNFNQDYTSIGVGTRKGYKLFTIASDDKIEEICENACEDTCIVERLFSSSLVAVVSLSSPRKLQVCHFKKRSEICNYSYPNTILSVKLNRLRLVVCLEESIFIHNIRDMKVLHTIKDTPPNLSGICALAISSEQCLMAYPGSNVMGQVQIFDTLNLQAKIMIPAHEGPLAALAFNESGSMIATASEKGTVIRVFGVEKGNRLFELRRGMKRCAHIYSLSFSKNSQFLLCSSNTETVHIFKLEEVNTPPAVPEESTGIMGWMSKAVSASASYLPSPVTDIIRNQPRILVASEDGFLYIYKFNTTEGGECTLLKQHRLCGESEASASAASDSVPVPQGQYPGGAQKSETDIAVKQHVYAIPAFYTKIAVTI
ncbi:WD repeat domain phosphoinositide-interacting protein 2, partial [Armadillidium nasatum]